MTPTAKLGGACGVALLALSLLVGVPAAGAAPKDDDPVEFTCTEDTATAAPAESPEPRSHPSGKPGKGEIEPGGSGTQGRSDSDPDGMANGGADKPGCTGGYDDDRDGNNGCGNDADFEDDNNGNCGKGGRARVTEPDGFAGLNAAPEEAPAPAARRAPAPAPAPAAEKEDHPEPVVDEPDPAIEPPAEDVEGPLIWGDPDADTSNDPDPDEEYPGDPAPSAGEDPPAGEVEDPGTEAPDMTLAAHHDFARTGGILAAGLLIAVAALRGGGRLVVAVARRCLSGIG